MATKQQSSTSEWFLGLLIASVFSLAYILTPIYLLASIGSFFLLPLHYAIAGSLPIIISILIPPTPAPKLVGRLTPMLSYFDFQESFDCDDETVRQHLKEGRRFILAFQPHGVISFVGLCAAVSAPSDLRALQTAVASSLLQTPILKHVMGIFGLVDASKASMQRHFKKPGIHGCLALYVGGIAELFKTSRTEERLFLSKRKGFIKLALQEEAVDVVPCYLLGNTSVLTIFKHGPLASLSRRSGVALTYFWGKWGLPVPRDETLVYARGKPMGIPHIPQPTQADIDKWHAAYCDEVSKLFDKNKERLPSYKHKKLYID